MSDGATIPVKFISDEKALATMEAKLEKLTNSLNQMAKAGERAGKTKIDPIASRMSGGSTGADPMIAKLNAYSISQKQAESAAAYRASVIERSRGMNDGYGTFKTPVGLSPAAKHYQLEAAAAAKLSAQREANLALMNREIARYQKLGSAKSDGLNLSMPSPGGLVKGMVGAIGAVGVAAGERHARWGEDVSKSSFTMSELELKLMNQADMSKQEAQEQIRLVGGILKATPSISTLTGGVEMQTWLQSAGLNKGDVQSGKMLNVIAEGLTTLNAFGKDKGFTSDKESVRTIVGGAKAFGLGDDAAAVKKMSDIMSMGFKVSAMEAQHLPSFLKEGSAMSAFGVKPEQAMGIFSSMVSSGMPAETSAVGMRSYATKLSDVRGDGESEEDMEERKSKRARILQSLDLTQSDVQVTSKNDVFKSLSKLRGALAGKSEGERQSAITGIFGAEQYSAISMMLRDQDKMKSQTEAIGDNSTLGKTIAQSRRHQSFGRARTSIGNELTDWESGVKIGTTWKDIEDKQAERYSSRMSKATGAGERFGIGVEDVMLGIGNFFAKRLYTPEEIAPNAGAKRQEELLERAAIAAEKTAERIMERERNRNGNVEPVGAN